MKISTWNVNSVRARLPHIVKWLEAVQPDVLALQETKAQDHDFPVFDINAAGYEVIFTGQKSYNGVAILSKKKAVDVITDIPTIKSEQKRIIGATFADIRVLNLYVPNGTEAGCDKYYAKLEWLKNLCDFLKKDIKKHEKYLIVGDFNIAPDDRDVYDPKAWEGHVLVTPKERAVLKEILDIGFFDVFRKFEQPAGSYSWFDYRHNMFLRKKGLRIDLMLASAILSKKCIKCDIDITPRGWERPSDHTPVVVEFK